MCPEYGVTYLSGRTIVEELNRVAFFSDTRHDVPLHDRADVAGAQIVLADVTGQESRR